MKFTKIKYDGERVILEWVTKKLNREEVEQRLTSAQRPSPAFIEAMQAFQPIVFDLLRLPLDYASGFRVTGLSINEEEGDGRAGLVITCRKTLPDCNSPLILNTPHMREPVDDNDDGPGFYIEGVADALALMCEQAEKFVGGERDQGDLFASESVNEGQLAAT